VNYKADVVFSVVIPVFNEEGNLKPLHTRLTKVMRALKKPYEIIFVDDGSTDKSFDILYKLHERDKHTKVTRFTRNFGQFSAILAGLHSVKGQVIITIDADLQNPPEEIPKLIKRIEDGYDVVFGVFKRPQEPIYRRAGSALAKWVLSKIMPRVPTNLSGFRALRADVVEQLKLFGERHKFIDGLICWMGFKLDIVEVARYQRHKGKSKYNLFKLISLWLNMVVSFTDLPLRLAMLLGAVFGIVGLLMAVVYLICYFVYKFTVPGFTTTIILITVFAGVQLLCLGIIGEYIGRMNIQIKKRPDYIIREEIDS
jgi:undecaprenyl-phosphate 4-deoxy-4-formamido-L-arabinose transferase